jgi:hypothetical protein
VYYQNYEESTPSVKVEQDKTPGRNRHKAQNASLKAVLNQYRESLASKKQDNPSSLYYK